MNVFVSRFYDDEMLYSHNVRYFAEFPGTSHDYLVRELFGTKLELSPHMPRNLSTFAERTEAVVELSKEEIFWSHTMYPFNGAYLPEELRSEIFDYAYFGTSRRRMPGILAALAPPKFLRWCPRCVLEDRNRADFGEAYWRRAHQLPGVWQCDKHLDDLVDSTVPRYVTGLAHVVAEVVLPKDVEEHRRERDASLAESMLRRRLLALLNSTDFAPCMVRPDYKSAALEAGFNASGGLVDYHALYEAFVDFWGDVLPRVDELHRTRVMGVGWLHGHLNAKKPIAQPVTRELIDIFFHELGVVVGERQPKVKPVKPIFYCPSPYADHGPGKPVRKVIRTREHPERVGIACECGLAVVVPSNVADKQIGMSDVIKVTRYGTAWLHEFDKLREQGLEWNDAAEKLGIGPSVVTYWRRVLKPKVRPLPDGERDALRSEWLGILAEIAPRKPALARENYHRQYARLLRYDRAWLEATMHAYRQEHNHPLTTRANWGARDEEYPERLVAAASRLLSMERVRTLTVGGLLKEAGIAESSVRRYQNQLPSTIATLARLTDGNLGPALSAAVAG